MCFLCEQLFTECALSSSADSFKLILAYSCWQWLILNTVIYSAYKFIGSFYLCKTPGSKVSNYYVSLNSLIIPLSHQLIKKVETDKHVAMYMFQNMYIGKIHSKPLTLLLAYF